ncbi:MAG: enoyl-CoA hydratase [Sulfuriferula multivorans]|uniref:Enoyl-CoA hydratase n=1 Tax=Sulfuriferula multivorans TaxID=1559896 RepID=A0A7C9P4S2_9PROT|nr:enoyl-CoA hydratase [Sulfuriferula multivorans]
MNESDTKGAVHLAINAGVASVLFDRPSARNAMTWSMYERLNQICEQLKTDLSVRVVTFRGAGGQAFVAGTDIEQFTTFRSGEDGVAYEKQIDQCIARLESLPMPTVAVIEGWTIGGGLAIATACDFRIATAGSRFGVPIAKTLGNCLSVANLSRLSAVFGIPRVKRMLMLAEVLNTEEALACGFLLQAVEAGKIDVLLDTLCERLGALASITQGVSKEGLRRLVSNSLPPDEDLIRQCYGSADFREGVIAFVGKRSPVWTGK